MVEPMGTRPTDISGSQLAALSAQPTGAATALPVGAPESPRLVTRGESSEKQDGATHPYAAFTDFLTVTFPFTEADGGVNRFFLGLCQAVGIALGMMVERRSGLHGFRKSFAFQHHGALFAYGGQNGRAMLSLPGEACAVVRDWAALAHYLGETLGGRITRWDGAVDDYFGERSVDDAVRWYLDDGFTAGGNRPACKQEGNWLTLDTKGRTFYVGRRKNGKLFRAYEKGKQLGDALSRWVRFELELHNKDREIPFDVLLRPGHYVAGSYPCMRWVSKEASRIRTIQNQRRISYATSVHWARISVGQLVNTMAEVEGSPEAVIDLLRRPGTPTRLDLPDVPPDEGRQR